ncbi:MAG: Molybdopterin or thiamine biosynthesis adenylyltransferase [Candidatus Kentron sp. G]|nr:MAG: Molybdopterin or thiamine biosynthesis adenylyltransferase [Candidatus Kentron sp. G]VFN02162.1 MAG: Molybdopterin or thiamine biosynthesis adenylyltransferase [Candidatus Kentron sp. G]VFN04073.1 MAG: Molybdopterin or thiamine biosynthesis adenylyltransferase [Candidatus Kentron sp. G]
MDAGPGRRQLSRYELVLRTADIFRSGFVSDRMVITKFILNYQADRTLVIQSERYGRHNYLPGWDQERFSRATIILMGLGALGNAAAQALALAGSGHLILCDRDIIEPSNLSRAPLFRESDVGRRKVEAAREALMTLVPGIRVDVCPGRFEHAIGLAEIRDADLTLGCLDSRAARLELAGRCGLVGAAWIDGATGPWSGEVRPYLDPDGPCYGCGLDDAARAEDDAPRSCRLPADGLPNRPAGATAPLSLVIGAHMASMAIRHCMGLPINRDIKVFDGISGQITNVQQERDPDCPFHQKITAAQPLRSNASSTVADLLAELENLLHHDQDNAPAPLAWYPFSAGIHCRYCGYSEEMPTIGGEGSKPCPRCGKRVPIRTHLELNRAPPAARLTDLGIAPREILAVREDGRIRYVELS